MDKMKVINKLISKTANREFKWQPYNNNTLNFHDEFYDNSQHFMPDISYVLKVGQGTFLLASFQAMLLGNEVAEEVSLSFYAASNPIDPDRIDDNSSDLYALRKLIELNIENIIPNFANRDPSNQVVAPSDDLSDFLDN